MFLHRFLSLLFISLESTPQMFPNKAMELHIFQEHDPLVTVAQTGVTGVIYSMMNVTVITGNPPARVVAMELSALLSARDILVQATPDLHIIGKIGQLGTTLSLRWTLVPALNISLLQPLVDFVVQHAVLPFVSCWTN